MIKLVKKKLFLVVSFCIILSCNQENIDSNVYKDNSLVLNKVLDSRISNFIDDVPAYHEMIIREKYLPLLIKLRNDNKDGVAINTSEFLKVLPKNKIVQSNKNQLMSDFKTEIMLENFKLSDRLYRVKKEMNDKYNSEILEGESALIFELEFSELLISALSIPRDYRYNELEVINEGNQLIKLNDSAQVVLKHNAYNFHYPGGYCIGPIDSLKNSEYIAKNWNNYSSFIIKGEKVGNYEIHGVYGTHFESNDLKPFTFLYTVM